jgi:hypothetical protein
LAKKQNKLVTTKQQTVQVNTVENRQVISIEPAVPNTLYVPYYNPAVVYGAWPYAGYPPYAFPYGGYAAGAAIAGGIAFGTGVAVGVWAANHGPYHWGGGFNWGNHNINVNRPININNNVVNNWTHNPDHRHGVRYNNPAVQQRFANRANHGNPQSRMDFRGHNGQQVLRPGGGGQSTARSGDRARSNIANSSGNRNARGNRGAGQRSAAARPRRDNAFSNVRQGGRSAYASAARGHASLGGRSSFARAGGGVHMGGGGFRGGGGFHGGGGFRRSDIRLKHDIALLGHLDNGLGFYRFTYNGSDKPYVGVMAQEVRAIVPDAVATGRDGFLRVSYEKLGLRFESYEQWLSSGAHIPTTAAGWPY